MQKQIISNSKLTKSKLLKLLKEQVDTFDFTHKTSITIDLTKHIQDQTSQIPDVQIEVETLAWLKMNLLVKNSTKELAWHGTVERISQDKFLITDVFTYPQIVTAATVDADENLYSRWILSRINQINSIRLQGHSHVNMGVSPSGTDVEYYKTLVNQVDDYYIFIILNKSGETHVRLYDKIRNVLFTDIKLSLHGFDSTAWLKEQNQYLKDKVYTAPTPPASTVTHGSFTSFDGIPEEEDKLMAEYYRYEGRLKGRYD